MLYWLCLHDIKKYVHQIISYDSNVLLLIEMKLKSQIHVEKHAHSHRHKPYKRKKENYCNTERGAF